MFKNDYASVTDAEPLGHETKGEKNDKRARELILQNRTVIAEENLQNN
jgi:hypothetical protein